MEAADTIMADIQAAVEEAEAAAMEATAAAMEEVMVRIK